MINGELMVDNFAGGGGASTVRFASVPDFGTRTAS